MAWRSSGTTNDEMVDNLKRFGVISTPAVEEAFRQVDRAFFVPAADKDRAHSDQPLRYGNLHISAPHIYGSVLEALELRPESSLSFLNVGSGTGYMSCIVATILGSHSNNYGVEIYQDVVEHAKTASQRWKDSIDDKAVPDIEWIHGNALQINPNKGEAIVGFDRIYIGASVDKEDLPKLACLLRPGGILVGPVEDELVKVVRIGSRSSTVPNNSRRNMMETDDANPFSPNDFTQEVLSGVRFAGLLDRPNLPTILPSHVWDPSVHHQYPDSFRESCREIMLCSKASLEQELPPVTPKKNVNAAGMLPRCLWMEILSFTHRDWFECPETETEFLRRRLREEQESAQRARNAQIEAENRCRLAEEEKEVYRVLARRYQVRLEAVLRQSGREEEDEEVGGALSGREQAVIYGLGAMLRSIQGGDDDDDDDDEVDDDDDIDEEEEDELEVVQEGQGNIELGGMDEDNEEMAEQEGDDESESSEERDTYLPLVSAMSHHAAALVGRPQRRTVSITGADF